MRILYVAKHNSGDNDDEGAIAYVLKKFGHEVICVHEKQRHRNSGINTVSSMNSLKADLCLFHKWANPVEIRQIRAPKVFWYFDMVESDDQLLSERSELRRQWFKQVMPHVDLAFLTDGSWVIKEKRTEQPHWRKYAWLMQGTDERFVGQMPVDPNIKAPPILFMGTQNHGSARVQQINMLQARYGNNFQLLGGDSPRNRKHQYELAHIIANTKIVIAPIGPGNDFYWSNRVYLTLGFGGFLLHPRYKGMALFAGEQAYQEGKHYVGYETNEELFSLIDKYVEEGKREERETIARQGYERTLTGHLYTHRVIQLLNTCKEYGIG